MADQRVVAFLDILGFEKLLLETSLDDLSKKYEALVNTARAQLFPMQFEGEPTLFQGRDRNRPWCNQHIFSDSIILIANDDTEFACLELLVYVWRICQTFLGFSMPLRGAITFGEIYSNSTNNIFLGKALLEAYKDEGRQDWIGVSILDSVMTRYNEICRLINDPKHIFSTVFKIYDVPLKDVNDGREIFFCERRPTINWRYNLIVENGTRSLFKNDGDINVKRKIANTLSYAKHTVESGNIYWQENRAKSLIEMRVMFIGSREPPFPHGDDY